MKPGKYVQKKAEPKEPELRDRRRLGPEQSSRSIPEGAKPLRAGIGAQVADVLKRTWAESAGTYGQKQLLAEARKKFEDEGRGDGKEITREVMEVFLANQESSQLQAPLPAYSWKTNPGIFQGERVDLHLIDNSKSQAAKKSK